MNIGGQSKAKTYYFGKPTKIRTDSEGNIYVADQKSRNIRVFNSNGKFLRSIGERGKGPGEFGNILAFEVNNKRELVIFDGANRRITRYSKEGNFLTVFKPSKNNMIWPEDVQQLSNKGYLLLRKLRHIGGFNNDKLHLIHSTIMHLYDNSFKHLKTSFGLADSLVNTKIDFVQQYIQVRGNAGYFWPGTKGIVWYVPKIYRGQIFKFRENTDGWKLSQTIHGYIMPQEPVEINSNSEGATAISIYTNKGRKTFIGKINSESLGFFTLNDGRLVHFSSQLTNGKRKTIVELFNAKGELDGFGQLKKFTVTEKETKALIGYIWKDNSDRFYIIDNRGAPTVRVGQIGGLQNIK